MSEPYNDILNRLPPQALEAEQAVIGCCLLGARETVTQVREVLLKEHFYRDAHATIYESICRLYDRKDPTDSVMVSQDLQDHGLLDLIGGRPYLAACEGVPPATTMGPKYAKKIVEAFDNRELVFMGGELREAGYSGKLSPQEKALEFERRCRKVATAGKPSQIRGLSEMLVDGYTRIANLQGGDGINGIRTGFGKLDRITQGWQNGDLVVIAGRPASGKTSLALQTSVNAARQGYQTLFFSMEMTEDKVVDRIYSFCSGVNLYSIIGGNLSDEQHESLVRAAGEQKDEVKFVYDRLTTASIRATSHRFKRDHGLSMIVVDYLQIISSDQDRPDLRRLEVANSTKELKFLAKELNVPVLILCQSSRESEKRDDKRPQLSDLAESGHIEYEADIVMFTQLEKEKDMVEDREYQEQIDYRDAFIHIRKHRNGQEASIPMKFFPRIAAFKSVEDRYDD